MKTLIAYGTKHGRTEKWAKRLAEYIKGEVEVVNLKNCKNINVDDFDKVVIGSAIYAGRIRKEVKRFARQNLTKLLDKKVGLFICCMSPDNTVDSVEDTFPEELIKNAVKLSTFAGEFNISSLNFFEKMIVKLVTANSEIVPVETDLEGFAVAINEA